MFSTDFRDKKIQPLVKYWDFFPVLLATSCLNKQGTYLSADNCWHLFFASRITPRSLCVSMLLSENTHKKRLTFPPFLNKKAKRHTIPNSWGDSKFCSDPCLTGLENKLLFSRVHVFKLTVTCQKTHQFIRVITPTKHK